MSTDESVVKLDGIKRIYYKPDGSVLVAALDGIDLSIPKGQSLAIMGASGSGKSTLMNVLGCLDQPTEGTYMLGGIDVSSLDDEALSQVRGTHIGFIFQSFNLMANASAQANVELKFRFFIKKCTQMSGLKEPNNCSLKLV